MNEQVSKSAVALRTGAPLASIVPTNLDEVARIAKLAVLSGLSLAPKKKWGEDEDETSSDRTLAMATMTILHGMEVGLHPMQALQSIALVNGRPLIWGDAVPALLWNAGFKLREWSTGEGDDRTAHCEVTRPDGSKISRAFSVRDAKKARLWDERDKIQKRGRNGSTYEAQNDSPWHRFPERMLQMRARGFAVKDGASDVTRGLYLQEEYAHNEMVDVTPAREPAPLLPPIPDDIPEIPAEPVSNPDELLDVPGDDAPIADVDGFLAKLQEDRSYCESEADLTELTEANADIIARLNEADQQKARAILAVDE